MEHASNIRTEITAIMDEVNAVLTTYHSPDGPYDPMPVKLGIQELTTQDETPQVYWIPVKDGPYEVANEQPDDGMADYQTWTTINVKVWGSDLDEAVRIRDAVLTKGLRRFGKAFKPVGGGIYTKGLDAERGVMISFAIGLKYLIYGEQWIPVTITTTSAAVLPAESDPPAVQPTRDDDGNVTDAEGAHGVFIGNELGIDPESMQP